MTSAEYHPEFSNDLAEAAAWLEDEQARLGMRFIEAVENACREIRTHPCHHSYIDKPIRRILVKPFSYAVHYAIPEDGRLLIYGVYHCAMNPGRWRERR